MTFGSKLQQLRKAKGLSQEELADTLRVSRQAVSRWENDQGYPEMEKLVQISSVFSATTDFLLKEPSDNEEGERLYPGYYVSRETAEGFCFSVKGEAACGRPVHHCRHLPSCHFSFLSGTTSLPYCHAWYYSLPPCVFSSRTI